MTPSWFPEVAWFEGLGRQMADEGERFTRLGYAETRFVIRVLDEGGRDRHVGLVFEGYRLGGVDEVNDPTSFDPDFVLCAPGSVWRRMLDEISREGRPSLRHTLSSLVLVGDEMWIESTDQLREDRFYRFNQTLQEFFNLSGRPRKAETRG